VTVVDAKTLLVYIYINSTRAFPVVLVMIKELLLLLLPSHGLSSTGLGSP